MVDKVLANVPVLAFGWDALENKMRVAVALVFVCYIGIPLIKFLFGKKDD